MLEEKNHTNVCKIGKQELFNPPFSPPQIENCVNSSMKSVSSTIFAQSPTNADILSRPKMILPESSSERILKALGLNLIPDVPQNSVFEEPDSFYSSYNPLQLKEHYKKCNGEKKAFLDERMDFKKTDLILMHTKKSLEMQNAMNALREHLDLWEHVSLTQTAEYLEELKSTLLKDIKNLNALCDDLTKISQQKVSEIGSVTLIELLEKRKNEDVSTSSIRQQADLHQAIREAKRITSEEIRLNQLKEQTSCFVCPIKDIAFFKKGDKESPATVNTMEKLMWEIACIMGMEDAFVATEETTLRIKSDLAEGSETVMQWSKNGEIQKITNARPGIKGSIQATVKNSLQTIPREEVVDGILTSLVFGMYDAHSSNFMLNEDGKLKFFDNSASLPFTNGFFNYGRRVALPYRCSLLDYGNAKNPLTSDEVGKLKTKLDIYRRKMSLLKKYLSSKPIQMRFKALPPHSMDTAALLIAMENRISHMQQGIDAGQVKTLEDLVVQAYPDYKLAYALSFLTILDDDPEGCPEFSKFHVAVRRFSFDDVLILSDPIPLESIEKLSQDPKLDIEELSKRLKILYNQVKANPPTAKEKAEICRRNNQIHRNFFINAVQDYKTVTSFEWMSYCKTVRSEYVNDENMHMLCQNGIATLPEEIQRTVHQSLFTKMSEFHDKALPTLKAKLAADAISYAKENEHKAVIFWVHLGPTKNLYVVSRKRWNFVLTEFNKCFKPEMHVEKYFGKDKNLVLADKTTIDQFNSLLTDPTDHLTGELLIDYNFKSKPTSSDTLQLKDLPKVPSHEIKQLAMEKGLFIGQSPFRTLSNHLIINCRLWCKSKNEQIIFSNLYEQIDNGVFYVFGDPELGIEPGHYTIKELIGLFESKIDMQVNDLHN